MLNLNFGTSNRNETEMQKKVTAMAATHKQLTKKL